LGERKLGDKFYWTAIYTIRLPTNSTIVSAVRRGQAASAPDLFVDDIIGLVVVEGQISSWFPPQLTYKPIQKTTSISVRETFAGSADSSAKVSISPPIILLNTALVCSIKSPDLVIASINGPPPYIQTVHQVIFHGNHSVDLTFGEAPKSLFNRQALLSYSQIRTVLAIAWSTFLSIVVLLIIFAMATTGRLGESRRVSYTRSLAAVLIAVYVAAQLVSPLTDAESYVVSRWSSIGYTSLGGAGLAMIVGLACILPGWVTGWERRLVISERRSARFARFARAAIVNIQPIHAW
jgi:hypothetical protein